MGLREKIMGGAFWTAGRSMIRLPLALGISIALARLLEPADFGLIAFTMVFESSIAMLAQFGLEPAIIYRQDASDEEIGSLFWVTVLFGLLGALALLLCIPLMEALFDDPRLVQVAPWLTATVFLSAVNVVPNALLKKSLRYRAITVIDLGIFALSGAIAISMAYLGFGVWSLVAQGLSSGILHPLIMLPMSGFRPKLSFAPSSVGPALRFGANTLGSALLHFVTGSADRLMAGRLIGSTGLGLYTRAFGLPGIITGIVQTFTNAIWLPAMAQLREEPEQVKNASLRAFGVGCVGLIPVMVGLGVLSRHFILVLYGQKWEASAPILTLISGVFLFLILPQPLATLFQARGRPELELRWTLLASITQLAGVVLGALGGSGQSIASGFLAASVLLFLPRCLVPGALVGIRLIDLLRQLVGPALAGAVMAAGLLLALPVLGTAGSALELLELVLLGTLLYTAASLILRPPGVREIVHQVRNRLGPAGS